MILLENEQLDDLQNSYYIIQKKDSFKFGTDAVLLSDFAAECKCGKVLDLCSGTGIVPILLAAKTECEISALEIQEDMWEMSKRSVTYNSLDSRLNMICGDLRDVKKYFTPHTFDALTCNPPYMKAGAAIKNELNSKTISRHERLCDINDVVSAAAAMLRYHGALYMVHRPSRLTDILCAMRNKNIEPKAIRFVHAHFGKEPVLVLIKGIYQGGSDLKIMAPMYIYDENGEYTPELKKIYSGERNEK